ncbi:MAG: class I SAM-dependent methyltransferase [Fimbriimonas sp.]
MEFLRGIHRAPNIQTDPGVYEIENRSTDPGGLIEAAMREIADWRHRVVLDLGAGTGFYIPLFHPDAAHVIAVEPHAASRLMAMERVVALGLEKVSVMHGSAAETFLANQSVDIVHARFAYFWPPNCVPGIQELDRIVRPGGTAFIIDNDYDKGTFASWLKRRFTSEPLTQEEKERFWASYGFSLRRIRSEWRFETREDFEAVVRLEFGAKMGDVFLAEHSGLSVDYTYCLYHRTF